MCQTVLAVMITIDPKLTVFPQDKQPDAASLQPSEIKAASGDTTLVWEDIGNFSEPSGPVKIDSIKVEPNELAVHTRSKDVIVAC